MTHADDYLRWREDHDGRFFCEECGCLTNHTTKQHIEAAVEMEGMEP